MSDRLRWNKHTFQYEYNVPEEEPPIERPVVKTNKEEFREFAEAYKEFRRQSEEERKEEKKQ